MPLCEAFELPHTDTTYWEAKQYLGRKQRLLVANTYFKVRYMNGSVGEWGSMR